MKFECEVTVVHQSAPNVRNRPQRSTLAIGYHPPNSRELNSLFIIHFSDKNKVGKRYKIQRNLNKIFTKFVADGRTTISFKDPPEDLMIRCDPVQLKCFLQALKAAMDGKHDSNKNTLANLAVTPVPRAAMIVKRLTITRPSEYPDKGLPRTLTTLEITGLRMERIKAQVFMLMNLKVLNLSKNCLKTIPKQLGDLRLEQLILTSNQLHESRSDADWRWLEGGSLQSSLQNLDLSDNKLEKFPYKIVKLSHLVDLNLKDNKLTRLPFAVRRLKNLKFLNLANNRISQMPNSISQLYFNTVDLSGTEMSPEALVRRPSDGRLEVVNPESLLQLTAKKVRSALIPYSPRILPGILIDLLEESPICPCGKICLLNGDNIVQRIGLLVIKTQHLMSSLGSSAIYADAVYCNEFCKFKYFTYVYERDTHAYD